MNSPIKITAAERVWLSELLRKLKSGERVNLWQMQIALMDQLPKTFTPSDVNRLLAHEDGITLLGIQAIGPDATYLADTERLILTIRSLLMSCQGPRTFSAKEIAESLDLDPRYVESLIRLMSTGGHFWTSAQTSESGYDSFTVDRLESLQEFLRFESLAEHLSQKRLLWENSGIRSESIHRGQVLAQAFISWSGERSRRVAEALRELISVVLPGVRPWLSGHDIAPGERWQSEIERELEGSEIGVLVLTADNVNAPWVIYEAGALSNKPRRRVCPYLVDLDFPDLPGPLSQFQSKKANKQGTRELVLSLHEVSGSTFPRESVEALFQAKWNQLESVLEDALQTQTSLQTIKLDPLTGLPNREAFSEAIQKHITLAEQDKCPVCLVLMDLDYFSRINDGDGHAKGDDVLREIACCMQRLLMQKGKLFRYGGEEFIVILPNHTWQEGVAAAERMRRQLEASRPCGTYVTASFGVAAFPEHQRTASELLNAVDSALYDAKQRGRNLVRAHGDSDSTSLSSDRKLPKPGLATEAELQRLRLLHFRGEKIKCPKDRALLAVEELEYLGSTTSGIRVHCPVCGTTEDILGE